MVWLVVATAAATAALALLAPSVTEAHKAITSPYTYNDHVYPILRERCSRCHFEGGPTPMSLMSYKDAIPWAESMREQLVGERMPPWYADPRGTAVKGGHSLPTRELDILVTWAVGGTPQGDLAKEPAPFVARTGEWPGGEPDVKIPMDAEHTLPAGTMEETREFLLATRSTEATWVKAADLLPGFPSMVRDARISIENGPLLAAWVPGDDATAAPSGAAFKLPAGARIKLQIHYKKHWQDEQQARSDRSVVGLYLADAPPVSDRQVETLTVDGPAADGGSTLRKFSGTLKRAARIVAIRPDLDRSYQSVDIHAVLQSGRIVPLLLLRSASPQWYRRYWLAEALELPAGAAVEVVAVPAPPDAFGLSVTRQEPLQVSVDYVPQ